MALTAHAMKRAELECLAAGMDDYLSKPIDCHGLDPYLQRHLEENSSHYDELLPHAVAR